MRLATILLAGIVVASFSGIAYAEGINLSWSDCGDAGTEQEYFACLTNSGAPEVLVGSFVPPADVTQVTAIEATIEVLSSSAAMPAWWMFADGGCRATFAPTLSTDFTAGPFTCADPWLGSASSFRLYELLAEPDRARFRILAAMPEPRAIDASLEHYAFKLSFRHGGTVGTGSCAGCAVPVCMMLTVVVLYQTEEDARHLFTSDVRNTASWQNGFLTYGDGPGGTLECIPGPPTSAAATTWGKLKSLYR